MLTSLECAFNELTSLDISQNTALTNFTCSHNLITSLDVSQNTALSQFSCNNNELTDIDVTLLTGLETLNVFDNHLTSLDVSQNVLLDDLDCSFNEITSIDVTQNTALTLFSCRSNQLTSLDVSQNTALIELPCQDNQFTSLDVSQNTALTYLDCRYNQLTSLNVKNGNNTSFTGFSASTNPDLTCITVDDVAYSTANWTDIDPQTSFSEDCSLSVGDQELNESISIYPNPVKNSLNISIKQDGNYSIMAMNGQVVKKGRIAIGENTLDVSSLTQGIYLINLKTDKGNVTKKLILK
jgi:Leucine-rich repeat (LRR) protein